MNRCAICDITDEDNPKAHISVYPLFSYHRDGIYWVRERQEGDEMRCLSCHFEVQECLEDLNLSDDDFSFSQK